MWPCRAHGKQVSEHGTERRAMYFASGVLRLLIRPAARSEAKLFRHRRQNDSAREVAASALLTPFGTRFLADAAGAATYI